MDSLMCREDNLFLKLRREALDAFQPFAFRSALTRKLKRMHFSAPKAELSRTLCENLPSAHPPSPGVLNFYLLPYTIKKVATASTSYILYQWV